MSGPADPARSPDPPASEGPDPGVPLVVKILWSAFAIWAVAYFVLYLVPDFRDWRGGGR